MLDDVIEALRGLTQARDGRSTTPTAVAIGNESASTTERGGPRGYDAGKKINGCKQHLVVDVDGSPIVLHVHETNIQDRDGASELIMAMLRTVPTIRMLFADGGYSGPKLCQMLKVRGVSGLIAVVEKPRDSKGFTVLYRRWVVERTFPGWGAVTVWQRISSDRRGALWPERRWQRAVS